MKYPYLLVLFLGLIFFQCSSDSDDNDNGPDANCQLLQEELNDATSEMVTAFSAYTKNTSDDTVCKAYKTALENRIEKAQALLDSDCIESEFIISNSEQAIAEDQESIDKLAC